MFKASSLFWRLVDQTNFWDNRVNWVRLCQGTVVTVVVTVKLYGLRVRVQGGKQAASKSERMSHCCVSQRATNTLAGPHIAFQLSKMPRKRLRKTERAQGDIKKYENAYEEVNRGTSLRRAAEMHDVNCMSLLRDIRKHND
ncbi:unnamed protein product [Chrysodeixis includens]|uniref:Uncharacterized protein n=1 Tax=Chrysodeixis includens TaxID=689277 RepID=A0A9N8PWH1_CHRIL|nr:unnamed protein product [Chrysodeixis includens]